MTVDLNAKLDAIFNARAERESEAVRLKREAEQLQEANLKDFLALKESVIRPALEALVEKLNERGHKAKVFENADGEQINGNTRSAAIGIRFLLDSAASYRSGNEYPHLSMSVDKAGRQVQFYACSMSPGRGGSAGGDGSVAFEGLSEDMIYSKALKIIAHVYK